MFQHQPTIDLLARVTFEKQIIPQKNLTLNITDDSAATYNIFFITTGFKKTSF